MFGSAGALPSKGAGLRAPRTKVHPQSASLDDMDRADEDEPGGPPSSGFSGSSGRFAPTGGNTIARACGAVVRRVSELLSPQDSLHRIDDKVMMSSTNAEMLAKMPCSRRLEFLDEIAFLDDGLKLSLYNVLVSTGVSKWKVRAINQSTRTPMRGRARAAGRADAPSPRCTDRVRPANRAARTCTTSSGTSGTSSSSSASSWCSSSCPSTP